MSPQIGARLGIQFGMNGGADPMAGVSRDSASGIYCPANQGEWDIALTAAGITSGGPSIIHLLQEASGNPQDSSGNGFHLTAGGTPVSYQQSVTGWTRFMISGSDGGTGVLDNTSVSLPDPTVTSALMLTYAVMTATPVAIRNFQVWGTGANLITTRSNTTPRFQGASGGNILTGSAAISGAVRPLILQHDRANSIVRCATDLEVLTPGIVATAGKRYRLSLDVAGGFLYSVAFFGAAAELTLDQLRALSQQLGWTIAW